MDNAVLELKKIRRLERDESEIRFHRPRRNHGSSRFFDYSRSWCLRILRYFKRSEEHN